MNVSIQENNGITNLLNGWYIEIRSRRILNTHRLKEIIDSNIHSIEEKQNLLLYYSLLDFRYQFVIDNLSVSKSSFDKVETFDMPTDNLLAYYYHFFKGIHTSTIGKYQIAKKSYEKAEFYYKVGAFHYDIYQVLQSYKKVTKARNGIVRNKIVHHNLSFTNTSYNEYSADGIYVDGGKKIIIKQNQSYENDLSIEVASEHAGKSASQITVRDNTISNNIMSGIAIGGYDSKQGYAENNTITNNIFYKNDTKDQESGQIELNYDTRNNVITNNHIYASNSRIFINNNFNKNTGNKLDSNHYYGKFDQNNGL
nr:right-handed parallel beta-helix repeat-containing protein [Bacillus toyonensis]